MCTLTNMSIYKKWAPELGISKIFSTVRYFINLKRGLQEATDLNPATQALTPDAAQLSRSSAPSSCGHRFSHLSAQLFQHVQTALRAPSRMSQTQKAEGGRWKVFSAAFAFTFCSQLRRQHQYLLFWS